MSCVQFEHHKLFAFRFLRARLPQTVVVHICRACIQMYSGIVISFGCHSEFTDAQKPFFGLCFYIVLAVMLYGCALAGAVHTAGTARLYLFRLLPNLAPACCSSSLSFPFQVNHKLSVSEFTVCCCGTPSDVKTGPSLFSKYDLLDLRSKLCQSRPDQLSASRLASSSNKLLNALLHNVNILGKI